MKLQGDQPFGVAMTSIQTFSDVRSLDVTWSPGDVTLSDLGLKFSHVRKRCMNMCAKRPPDGIRAQVGRRPTLAKITS